jgi:NAD(P)-dependent dehydrogenase (short-subunit alcohol dehydrogenase family)
MKTVLVTGAGGGVAGALLPRLHQEGYRLLLSDPRPERMGERALRYRGATFVADLTRYEEAKALADWAAERGMEAVVHTVGGFAGGSFLQGDPGLYDWMMDLNLRTTFNLLHAALPHLEGRRGFFAAFAAGPAWTGAGPKRALYTAAKTALAALLRSVAGEAEGVRFLVLYPMGTIDTPANREAMPEADPRRWIRPEALAEALLLALRMEGGSLLELPVYPPR